MFKYVVVGAGMSGAVVARQIAEVLKEKVLVIEKSSHIGGRCYDCADENGILIHQYGPHIFHTSLPEVWEYLSRFTEWINYQHHVLGFIDGRKVPIPFNLSTLHTLLPAGLAQKLEKKLVESYGYNRKVPILKLREQKDPDLDFLADYVYEKVFLHYTQKQWGFRPEEIGGAVTARVPVYVSNDGRYFQDTFQGMPKSGYTRLFEKMLKHENIKLLLNTDYREILDFNPDSGSVSLFGSPFEGKLVFTGQIDELFDYRFGALPYRTINFKFETLDREWYQETGTVNYPNDYDFTRITEFKHMTGQQSKVTTILREYPGAYDRFEKGAVPLYPVDRPENLELYRRYLDQSKKFGNLYLIGRLADYKYYNMDIAASRALALFDERIAKEN